MSNTAFDVANLKTDKITLFDIRGNVAPDNSFSPWTRVAHYALQVKKLPYHVELLETFDIPAVSKALGLKPGVGFTPEPMYTLPAIYDPTTKRAIVDTLAISLYLDAQYPETPRIVPPGTEGLMRALLDSVITSETSMGSLIAERALGLCSERSKDHVRKSREKLLGMKIEDFTPRGDEAIAAAWANARKVFDGFDAWFGGNTFIMGGDYPSQADLHIASRVRFFRLLFGADSKEWKDMETWNGGRWARLVRYFDGL